MDFKEEYNNEVSVTLEKPTKITYFSDGVEEEMEEDHVDNLNAINTQPEEIVDPKTLSWGPWLSHYAWKSGSNLLYAVDYAGEGIANFLGITTPKYQIEIDEYERLQEEKRRLDEESAGWVPKNTDGGIPLVLNEPGKGITNEIAT